MVPQHSSMCVIDSPAPPTIRMSLCWAVGTRHKTGKKVVDGVNIMPSLQAMLCIAWVCIKSNGNIFSGWMYINELHISTNEASQTHCNNPVVPTYPVWAYYAHAWQCRCQEDPVSQVVPASRCSAPSNRIWNNMTLPPPKQQIWLRTVFMLITDTGLSTGSWRGHMPSHKEWKKRKKNRYKITRSCNDRIQSLSNYWMAILGYCRRLCVQWNHMCWVWTLSILTSHSR